MIQLPNNQFQRRLFRDDFLHLLPRVGIAAVLFWSIVAGMV